VPLPNPTCRATFHSPVHPGVGVGRLTARFTIEASDLVGGGVHILFPNLRITAIAVSSRRRTVPVRISAAAVEFWL